AVFIIARPMSWRPSLTCHMCPACAGRILAAAHKSKLSDDARILPNAVRISPHRYLYASLLPHVLGEEILGALPRQIVAVLVEAAALVAMEAVAGVLVDVDLAVAAALLLDGLDVGHRDAGVLLTEVQLHRAFRLLVGEGDDAA